MRTAQAILILATETQRHECDLGDRPVPLPYKLKHLSEVCEIKSRNFIYFGKFFGETPQVKWQRFIDGHEVYGILPCQEMFDQCGFTNPTPPEDYIHSTNIFEPFQFFLSINKSY